MTKAKPKWIANVDSVWRGGGGNHCNLGLQYGNLVFFPFPMLFFSFFTNRCSRGILREYCATRENRPMGSSHSTLQPTKPSERALGSFLFFELRAYQVQLKHNNRCGTARETIAIWSRDRHPNPRASFFSLLSFFSPRGTVLEFPLPSNPPRPPITFDPPLGCGGGH